MPNGRRVISATEAFLNAIMRDTLERVQVFVEQHHCPVDGHVLHYACRFGNVELVQYLMEHASNGMVESRDGEHGEGLLHTTCSYSRTPLPLVHYLTATRGANVEQKDRNGCNVLHYACDLGQLNVVQYLVTSCGANARSRSYSGSTPLHWACGHGSLAVVQYLVETCRVALDDADHDGWTAWHWASFGGHVNVLRYLHQSGQVDVHVLDCNGKTALHYASRQQHLVAVQYLVESCRLNVEASSYFTGETALHRVCALSTCASASGDSSSSSSQLDVLRYLVQLGQANMKATTTKGETVFHLASKDRRTIRTLLFLVSVLPMNG